MTTSASHPYTAATANPTAIVNTVLLLCVISV
jgi:hypothetical protein